MASPGSDFGYKSALFGFGYEDALKATGDFDIKTIDNNSNAVKNKVKAIKPRIPPRRKLDRIEKKIIEKKTLSLLDREFAQNEKENEYWLPQKSYFTNGVLSIKIIGQYYKSIAASSRSDKGNGVQWNSPKIIFNFIAPNEIMEPITHTWAPYESIAARIAEKASTFNRQLEELRGMGSSKLGKDIKSIISGISRGKMDGRALKSLQGQIMTNPVEAMDNLARAGLNANVSTNRVDTPLVYKDTSRRQYDFMFSLFNPGDTDSIITPIRLLQQISSPKIGKTAGGENNEGIISIAEVYQPFIFRIESYMGTQKTNFISIKRAVLTQINVTYRGPYFSLGEPSTCDLQLSFQSLDPTWDSSFS